MLDNAYKKAGVDIDAGAALVENIKPFAKRTARKGIMGGLGGFGAFFDVKAAGFNDPVLVSSTDGVGTKLKIAIDTGIHDTVGIDLVAMCVNDLITTGAEPLFFLDYFATGQLNVDDATKVIAGIAKGCEDSGCALIGGETAEMPGLYAKKDYDLAGFSVGAVERDQMITGQDVKAGDIVLGLASSGLHSNGFSLVRHIMASQSINFEDAAPFDREGRSWAEICLVPTKLYVKSIIGALRQGAPIKAMANITGGGLLENPQRSLPENLAVQIDVTKYALPPIFAWLKDAGKLSNEDLARTLNCGVGMVVVVPPEAASVVTDLLTQAGEIVYKLGQIIPHEGQDVVLLGCEEAWGA
jgi:phosphoribosylformylglycinamidine cyclo-ligase